MAKLGSKISEATRQKMSLAKIGNKISLGKHWKLSDETKKKMSKAKIGNKHSLGNIASAETRQKMSLSRKGVKSYRWLNDRTLLKVAYESDVRRSNQYKDWRKLVCDRDNWKCKMLNNDCKGRLEVHHILSFTEFPELRYDVNNGITLCHAHHPRKRVEEVRLSSYFQELLKV
jgi:hypothetical protein